MENETNIVNENVGESGGVTYTQEQVDQMRREWQSKTDQRVTTAIDTTKAKLQEQFNVERQSYEAQNLTTEEQIRLLNQKIQDMERSAKVKDNLINITQDFTNNGITVTSELTSILESVVTDDYDRSKGIVDNLLAYITGEKAKLDETYNKKMSSIPKPQQSNKTVTKEDFDKMSYQAKLEFKNNNPELAMSYMGY